MIYIICAVGKNNEIGKNNELIWHLKNDMAFFRKITTGSNVVMGKNTYISIGHALKNRNNYVISRTLKALDATILTDIQDILKIEGDTFIIGGAMLYNAFINKVDQMYLTHIDDNCKEADTFFPSFNPLDFDITTIEQGTEENINYEIKKYVRK